MRHGLRLPRIAALLPLTCVLLGGCGDSGTTNNNTTATPTPSTSTPLINDDPRPAPPAGGATVYTKDKYEYYMLGRQFTDQQKTGRDTWIMWTGGNEAFFKLGRELGGKYAIPIEYFRLLDTRNRKDRFQRLGLVNEPNCKEGKQDEYGLWLDEWLGDDTYPDTKVYGEPTGVVGLRKFKNPNFDKSKWNVDAYFKNPGKYEPPYLIGMSCGFCHMGFNPLKPPADPENPRWENLAANLGNQFLHEGGLFFGDGKIVFGDQNGGKGLGLDDFLRQYAESQERGTSETSRLSYDFVNNPNVMNSIFNLHSRPAFNQPPYDGPTWKETLGPAAAEQVKKLGVTPDQLPIHHVLKDGSDSQGIPIASIRVYANIGMCGKYWITRLWNPFTPDTPQKPFDMAVAAKDFPEWDQTLQRMPALEAYLSTYVPMYLEDADNGAWKGTAVIPDAYKTGTSDQQAKWKTVDRGQDVFAEQCAFCHSSKTPDPVAEADDLKALLTLKDYYRAATKTETDTIKQARAKVVAYYKVAVKKPDFLANNALTDDVRYPVSELKTNAARALATNAAGGHVWDQFSSPEYKALPASGELTLYNPVTGANDRKFTPPAGGRGYYRTSSLVCIWATAPFLHNNSVGAFNSNPSVATRLQAFDDAIHKLLWPKDRAGLKSIKTTTTASKLSLRVSVLGSVAHQKLKSLSDELKAALPKVPGLELPEFFKVNTLDELKDEKIDDLAKLSISISIPAGTPINLLTNLNASDPQKRLMGALGFLKYTTQTDIATKARKLGLIGKPVADVADALAKKAMEELLSISELPDLVEDHGHEYGADLPDADKAALIEYLKKL